MHCTTLKAETKIILLIEFLFFSIAAGYLYFTPLWVPADEERHFAYCEFIARYHTLAVFKPEFEENEVYMAFHPPLYYMFGSLVCDNDSLVLDEHLVVNDGPGVVRLKNQPEPPPGFSKKIRSAYILRCISLVLSGITVCLVFKSAQLFFPNQLAVQTAAALFVALNPEFTHVSISISNDPLNIMLATASLYGLACFLQKPRSIVVALLCGIFSGCALMTKTTSLFLVPLILWFAIYMLFKEPRKRALPVLLMVFLSAVLGGWWYVRNWILFDDPFFSRAIQTAHPWAPRYAPIMIQEIKTIICNTLFSYFGSFGGSNFPLPKGFLLWYGGITALGCLGCGKHLFSCFHRRRIFPVSLLYAGALMGGIIFFIIFNLNFVGACAGRYLFAVIGPATLMIIAGLQRIIPVRFQRPVFVILSCGGAVLNIGILLFVLRPCYIEPRLHVGVCQEYFDSPTPDISITTTIGQRFFSPYNRLCAINIIFSNPHPPLQGTIHFTLRDSDARYAVKPPIHCLAKTIEDFGSYFFIFPPIEDSCGKTYEFTISSHDLPTGTSIALWRAETDIYPDGTMLVNNQPVAGDLYFRVYYFTGDIPVSKWEGVQPIAIANGIYLDIWELQLYQERSKTFRQTTTTHKKFLQLQKAYTKRRVPYPKVLYRSTLHCFS